MNEASMRKDYLYWLDDKPEKRADTLFYVFQWLTYSAGSLIPIPLILAPVFGLDAAETAAFMQRILLFSGGATLIQALIGYRMPMVEGPSTPWWTVMVGVAAGASQLGIPAGRIRTNMEFALIVSGLIVAVLAKTGVFQKIEGLFSPIVLGTSLILLPLQGSKTMLLNMLGVQSAGGAADPFDSAVSILTAVLLIVLSLKLKGFMQTIAVLICIAIGCAVYAVAGKIEPIHVTDGGVFSFPGLFPWGAPTFDMGMTVMQLILSFITVIITTASLRAMLEEFDLQDDSRIKNGLTVHGIVNLVSGVGASSGTIPYASSLALAKLSRVASLHPVRLFGGLLILLGLFPPFSAVLVAVPQPVANAVFLVSMATLVCVGIREYGKLRMNIGEMLIIGTSLMVGIAVMGLPSGTLRALPAWLYYLAGNGLIMGVLTSLLLENFLKLTAIFSKEKKG